MNTGIVTGLFRFLVFPGLLFTGVVGLLLSWVDRKVTARIQYRVGPPLLQPFYDFVKLIGKQTVLPAGGSRLAFLGAPLVGLAGVTLAATLLGTAAISPQAGFSGDVIILLYLLVLPALAVILGGIASRNPLASVGASREMKLVLSYELPFILAVLVPVIQSGGTLSVADLLSYQARNGAFAWSLSGALALVAVIPCLQAKLALVPFDQAEAETEIMAGALIEYSGAPLAVFKLIRAMMLLVMPVFLVEVLWGGFGTTWSSALLGVGKYLVLLVVAILLRNTNPRLRIEHAMKFFWGPVTGLAVLAVVLALLGV
ncbi:MAG: respiratory chain complex I subunit 1 family protein [Planctomycetota bacterium]